VRQYKVCVADDCVDETKRLCDALDQHNYVSIQVSTGEEAIATCESGDIDLLILSTSLSDTPDTGVARHIRDNPDTCTIPILLSIQKSERETVQHQKNHDAEDYIIRPYNFPMVMLRLDAMLRKGGSPRTLTLSPDFAHDTAYTDQLTGLRNRRFLLERLQEEVEKAHRHDFPVSCIVVDIDDILAVEEGWGAAATEDILAEIAMALRGTSRNYDILARYDGAQFAAVLPHAPLDDAILYAQKIQEAIDQNSFCDPPSRAKVRFGIASCRNGSAKGAKNILGEAMKGLLQAKSQDNETIVARDLNST
jgi:diguanylate cyclase (GGDEF)-like protein